MYLDFVSMTPEPRPLMESSTSSKTDWFSWESQQSSSPSTMTSGYIPSRMAKVLRLLLWALCAIALHMSSGNATMICTTTEIPEKSLLYLLEEGSCVWNMTMYDGLCQVVSRADSGKLNPLYSEGFLLCVCHRHNEAKDENQDRAEGLLFCWHDQNNEDLLKGGAACEINRTPRLPKAIETFDKEGAHVQLAWHYEDWICLRIDSVRDGKPKLRTYFFIQRKLWPSERDDLGLTSIYQAVFNGILKNDDNAFKTGFLDAAQGWEYVLLHTPFRGFSGCEKILNMTRVLFNQEETGKGTGLQDYVGAKRNIQVEELSNLPYGGQSSTWRRRLFQEVAPVVSPVEEPPPPVEEPPPPVEEPPPPVEEPPLPVEEPPPPVEEPPLPVEEPPLPVVEPPPPVEEPPPPVEEPPPPVEEPPPPVEEPPPPVETPPPPPAETPVGTPVMQLLPPPDVYAPVGEPDLTPPPSNSTLSTPNRPPPPTYTLTIPADEADLVKPTIIAPDTWQIKNVSVYVTGIFIPFIRILPSSILLMREARRKRHHVEESHSQQYTIMYPKPIRRLFQLQTMPAAEPSPPPALAPPPPPDGWMPRSAGVSQYLLMFLQVNAGSMLIPLSSVLIWNAKHQPTDSDLWYPLMNATYNGTDQYFQLVPGAGIQFMGTVEQINDALLDLQFGLGLGNGKSRTVNLVVMAVHQYVNLTSIPESTAKKTIVLQVTGAGAWFVVFQYTKNFYNSAVGVLCFFALVLILLCCILGCCMCHDRKMEKTFEANKAALKNQNLVFNETRVFNPVWIPSAVVGPGRGRFIIFHNPKFLQQRLAEHLSSLHGAVVEKVVTITGFSKGKGEESLGLQDDIFEDGSENSPLSSMSSTQGSMLPSGTSPEDASDDEGGSESTHFTIKDDRRPGSPLSMTNISEDSGSSHYDIGSPGSASDSDETESEAS